jgi:hypothetical protein
MVKGGRAKCVLPREDDMFPILLIQLIETHAENLSEGLLRKLKASNKCSALLAAVPTTELKHRVYEIYRHLSDWLLYKSDSEVEERFIGLGVRRSRQGVPFSEFLWTIYAVKEHLWDYIEQEGLLEQPVDLYGDRELLQSLEKFFDRALYFAAIGYESAHSHRAFETAPMAREVQG